VATPRSPESIRDAVTGRLAAWRSGVSPSREALAMLPALGQLAERGIAQTFPGGLDTGVCWGGPNGFRPASLRPRSCPLPPSLSSVPP